MLHTFLDNTIDFNIVYKQRKSVGIYVDIYGQIEVHAPKGAPIEKILHAVEDKWDLILAKSTEMKDRISEPKKKIYNQGEIFLYLGKSYTITILPNPEQNQDYCVIQQDILQVYVKDHTDEAVKQALKRFYYQQCKALIEVRIRLYQKDFKMKPRSIRIIDDSSKWGSCSSKLELHFNWKLAMAPVEVIDYVVVHEMCHMVHLNHDRSFWRLVGKMLPDYESRSAWLAISGWKMVV